MKIREISLFLFFISFSSFLSSEISFISSKTLQDEKAIQIVISFNSPEEIDKNDISIYEYQTSSSIKDLLFNFSLNKENITQYNLSFEKLKDNDSPYVLFTIEIKENRRDFFIFLSGDSYTSELQDEIVEDSSIQIIEEEETSNELIILADEITTVWSMASSLNFEDLSIYQVMWSIFENNRAAFIDDNINLIRKDIDINIPIYSEIRNISYQYAKDSILEMNEVYSSRFSLASKSLLVLTAPSVDDNQKLTAETPNSKIENISVDDSLSPKELIEMNTRDLSVKVENQTAESFLEDVNDSKNISKGNNIRIVDILFISVISLVSGIFLALIFINLKNIRKSRNKIDYDFEEVREDDSEKSMPSGLSVENNESQQQLDLAVMYIEMEELEKAKNILNELIQNSDDVAIVDQASALINKIK